MWKINWQRGRENKDRELYLSLAGSFPKWLWQLGLRRSNPGTWNSTQVSHVIGSIRKHWVMFCCFPSALAGNWTGSRAARTQAGTDVVLLAPQAVAYAAVPRCQPCSWTFFKPCRNAPQPVGDILTFSPQRYDLKVWILHAWPCYFSGL